MTGQTATSGAGGGPGRRLPFASGLSRESADTLAAALVGSLGLLLAAGGLGSTTGVLFGDSDAGGQGPDDGAVAAADDEDVEVEEESGLLRATPRGRLAEAGTPVAVRLSASPELAGAAVEGRVVVSPTVVDLLDGIEIAVGEADVAVEELSRLQLEPQLVSVYALEDLDCGDDVLGTVVWRVEDADGEVVASDRTDVVAPSCDNPEVVEAPRSVDWSRPRWSDDRRRNPFRPRPTPRPTSTPTPTPTETPSPTPTPSPTQSPSNPPSPSPTPTPTPTPPAPSPTEPTPPAPTQPPAPQPTPKPTPTDG